MVLPLIFGAANAGLGIFSAISGAQQQNAATDLANRQAIEVYKQQQRMQQSSYNAALSIYEKKKVRYREQLIENQTAADKAYVAEQVKLNELLKGMRFNSQAMNIEQAQQQGKIAASGRTGNSAARMSAMVAAASGRNQAIMSEQFSGAVQAAKRNNMNTRDQLRIANRNAYWNVGEAPTPGEAPLPPMLRDGANPFATALNIGSSVLGGVQTGMNFASQINNLGWD